MLSKRSVSPLIATILLIVVSVILIIVVLTWGSGFTKENTDKANTFLDSSQQISKSGVFWLDSLIGNKVILKSNLNSSIEIKGYKILTTDFNSDYFWLNSYRSLENNLIFNASSLNSIPLVCVPESKFFLELIDINDQPYSIEINPRGNSSYTRCNVFNVPLWEFNGALGSYEIKYFSKNPELLFLELNFLSGWNSNSSYVTNITSNSFEVININGYGPTKNLFEIGKRYYYEISGITTSSEIRLVNASSGTANTITNLDINNGNFSEEGYFTAQNDLLYIRAYIGTTNIDKLIVKEVDPLPTITENTGYISATAINLLSIPSSQAYGVWEFDLYNINTGILGVSFVADSINKLPNYFGYGFSLIATDNRIATQIVNGGSYANPFYTSASYLKNNRWYGIKIVRLKKENIYPDIQNLSINGDFETGDASNCLFNGSGNYSIDHFEGFSGYAIKLEYTDFGYYGFWKNSDPNSKYLVQFKYKTNSDKMRIYNSDVDYSFNVINDEKIHFVEKEITTGTNSSFLFRFSGESESGKYFIIDDIVIRKIYPANTFAVFIKGDSFGFNWNLVSLDSEHGRNPTSIFSSYSTSNFFILDLLIGARVANIKITPEIK